MAQLSFDGLQPVGFGGRECKPRIDAELRLRIQNIKQGADEAQINNLLAKAFPEDEDYVREFLDKQMTPFEKQQLQAYLIAGAGGIRMLDQTLANMLTAIQAKSQERAEAENGEKGATNGE